MTTIVTDEQAEQVTQLLVGLINSEEVAAAHGAAMRTKDAAKAVFSSLVLSPLNTQKSVGAKEHWAYTQPEYRSAADAHVSAQGASDSLKSKMRNCETVLSVWQTAKKLETSFDRRMS